MNLKTFVLVVLTVVFAAGCFLFRQSDQPRSNANPSVNQSNETVVSQPVKTDFNACALLPSEEIEKVQGEKVTEAKNSSRISGSLLVSQCFYQLGNYSKSVSLEITQSAKSGAEKTDLSEIWKKQFNGQILEDNDREEEEAERKEQKKSEHEESPKPIEPVPNLGEAAFRVGNRINKALYVLKNNTIVRISLGGTENDKIKAEKMTTLAQKLMPKL